MCVKVIVILCDYGEKSLGNAKGPDKPHIVGSTRIISCVVSLSLSLIIFLALFRLNLENDFQKNQHNLIISSCIFLTFSWYQSALYVDLTPNCVTYIETMFSMFQTLVFDMQVLNKSYSATK